MSVRRILAGAPLLAAGPVLAAWMAAGAWGGPPPARAATTAGLPPPPPWTAAPAATHRAPAALAVPHQAPPPGVVIDGRFDDWADVPAVLVDERDAPGAGVDFGEVRVTHDDEALYLLVDFGRAVVPHGLPGTAFVLLDADGDPATGRAEAGLRGVDLIVDLSLQPGPDGQPGSGIGVRVFPRDPAAEGDALGLDGYSLGLVFEPHHAARRFEFRFERGTYLPGGLRPFTGASLAGRLVFLDGRGRRRDDTAIFRYALSPGRPAPHASGRGAVDPLARGPDASFRVLSWNVSRAAILERPDPFIRILRSLSPDVLLLDEVSPRSSGEAMGAFLATVGVATGHGSPAGPGGGDAMDTGGPGWSVVFGGSGGGQRGVIAGRGTVTPLAGFDFVPYPDSLRDLLGRFRRPNLEGLLRSLEEAGVPALAAAVGGREGRRILAVTLDLQCCGDGPASPEDRMRRIEAAAIRAALRTALDAPTGEGAGGAEFDAVLVGGDFNLVGSAIPRVLLSRGLDLDGSDLEAVLALQLDGRSTATWDASYARLDPDPAKRSGIAMDAGAWRFPPGRLDFLLYSDSRLEPTKAFVFDSRDLSEEWLERHGLRPGDSLQASDHLPIVADFRWREVPAAE